MPSHTIRSLKGRSIPLAAAATLSVSIYAIHSYTSPILADAAQPIAPSPSTSKKPRIPVAVNVSPYTPIAWGTNRYMTLLSDPTIGVVKKPTPLPQLGSTPLRDLVIGEKYGACVDARGDCWMWGVGYDPSGEIGRSLKGKNIKSLIPASAKMVALSKDGKIYLVPVSKSFQDAKFFKAERSWWNWAFGTNPGVDFVQLKADGLGWNEKFTQVSAGSSHVLALTNKGRAFSIPLTPSGNSHRQLGTRQTFDEPNLLQSSTPTIPSSPAFSPEVDIRFATKLTEIPSLKSINIAQVATSDRTSFVRTPDGKVLGWGANEAGQIGLGANAAVETITVPVEVVLAKAYPGGTQVKCSDVTAAGQMTFYTVERRVPGQETAVDLLACGNGVSGSLGNGMWSNACVVPTRVKTVSGLQEYSEKENKFLPLAVHNISLSRSPSAHVFAVLDTVSQADQTGVKSGIYGKDVMVWGGNVDYQLGNGKRSSMAIPQHLPPVVGKFADLPSGKKEAGLSSGTQSPMPHSRLQFHQSKANAYDLDGKLISRNVRCEETIVAGWNASVLYNKII